MKFKQVIRKISNGSCEKRMFRMRNGDAKTPSLLLFYENGLIELEPKGCPINPEWEWEEVKNPVTWTEILKTNKLVRCEHEKLLGLYDLSFEEFIKDASNSNIKRAIESYCYCKYTTLADMMLIISSCFTDEAIREILNNGEWYIED